MDEYVWLLLLLGFWVFEIVGKALKRRAGGDAEGEAGDPSIRDPRVAKRQLSREIAESARRAEDALNRWDEGQAEVAVAPAPAQRQTRPVRRQSALEAIASMLVELPREEPSVPIVQERVSAPTIPEPVVPERRRASEIPKGKLTVPATVRREKGGRSRLARLPELQRAIVLSEILGPPVSLAPHREYGSA